MRALRLLMAVACAGGLAQLLPRPDHGARPHGGHGRRGAGAQRVRPGLCPLLTAVGPYNHVAAAAMLVVAFAAEAGATMLFTRRWRAELA